MSNFCLQQTAFHPSGNAVLPISSLVKNWLVRRAVSRLDRLNDRLLRDVGITRDDVRWAASLPLSENAARALMMCAEHRRIRMES
jgi:uncharacterized protein YjiS (DUF1127 family)